MGHGGHGAARPRPGHAGPPPGLPSARPHLRRRGRPRRVPTSVFSGRRSLVRPGAPVPARRGRDPRPPRPANAERLGEAGEPSRARADRRATRVRQGV